MKDLAKYSLAQSDGSGFVVLLSVLSVSIILASLAHFFIIRLQKKHALRKVVEHKDGIRTLTPYEKLRIKDFFEREVRTRYLEGYHDKPGNVGDEVFNVEGPARKHEFKTYRGAISSYLTVAGLEMLVPTSATIFLKNDHNYVEFVMVDDVAFVINVNGQFEFGLSPKESDQSEFQPTILGESLETQRLNPLTKPNDDDLICICSYLQSIAGDRLLVSDDLPSSMSLKFMLGIYWGIILVLSGLLPLIAFVFEALFFRPESASGFGLETFWYFWPFTIFLLSTLPFALLFWILNQVSLPKDYVVVFNRNSKQVLFLHRGLKPAWIDWKDLYARVEAVEWMCSYGFQLKEAFLELAPADRDHPDRVAVRLQFSENAEAMEAWWAIQKFMNGNLQTLTPHTNAGKVCLSPKKKLIHAVLRWLVGGPLPDRLTYWVTRQKQKLIWRRAYSQAQIPSHAEFDA